MTTFTLYLDNNTIPSATEVVGPTGTIIAYQPGGDDVAIADGGTGASTASGARTNLGLVIGSDVQAYDATLAALAAFNSNGIIVQTAADTFASRTIVANSAKISVLNGSGVAGDPTIDFGSVASSDLTDGSSIYKAGGTDVAVADGGTGSSTAAGARTNLGLVIGTDVQAYSAALAAIAAGNTHANIKPTECIIIACSDETTAITTGTGKVTFRMPYAFTLSAVRASVTTAPTGSTIVIDINEGGATILSTKLSIDASEKTSTTAATPAVISDTSLADDAEITIDFDQVGSTIAGAGVKVILIGTRT